MRLAVAVRVDGLSFCFRNRRKGENNFEEQAMEKNPVNKTEGLIGSS